MTRYERKTEARGFGMPSCPADGPSSPSRNPLQPASGGAVTVVPR